MIECGISDAISVSDYLTIHVTLAIPQPHRTGRVSVSRNILAVKLEDIEYELELIDWSPLYATSHVDEMVSYFTASLIAIFYQLAPITCRRVFCPPAPWLNGAVQRLIKLKSHAFLRSVPSGDLSLL